VPEHCHCPAEHPVPAEAKIEAALALPLVLALAPALALALALALTIAIAILTLPNVAEPNPVGLAADAEDEIEALAAEPVTDAAPDAVDEAEPPVPETAAPVPYALKVPPVDQTVTLVVAPAVAALTVFPSASVVTAGGSALVTDATMPDVHALSPPQTGQTVPVCKGFQASSVGGWKIWLSMIWYFSPEGLLLHSPPLAAMNPAAADINNTPILV
jgi:hypothetical protein